MLAPPIDFAKLELLTPEVAAAGERLLQGHLLMNDKSHHMTALLAHAGLPHGTIVADIGCGMGELARHWHKRRPDLQFKLVNKVSAQLHECPTGDVFQHYLADAHQLPLPDECCDVALFSYALCNMDTERALSEAKRILQPGGEVFLYEPVDYSGTVSKQTWREFLWANVMKPSELCNAAERAGLTMSWMYRPDFIVDPHFHRLLKEGNLTYLLDGVGPAIMEFTKEA